MGAMAWHGMMSSAAADRGATGPGVLHHVLHHVPHHVLHHAIAEFWVIWCKSHEVDLFPRWTTDGMMLVHVDLCGTDLDLVHGLGFW